MEDDRCLRWRRRRGTGVLGRRVRPRCDGALLADAHVVGNRGSFGLDSLGFLSNGSIRWQFRSVERKCVVPLASIVDGRYEEFVFLVRRILDDLYFLLHAPDRLWK